MTAPARRPRVSESLLRRKLHTLRDDFALWAAKCYRIKDKREQIIPLVLNDVQLKIEETEQELLRTTGRARIINLKGRQSGVTTYEQAKSLHTIWSRRGATCLTLTHALDATDKIFGITRRAIDYFPEELLPDLGGRETKEISFPARDSSFYTGTAGAKRSGHGLTLLRFHGSEFALWDDPQTTLTGVAPALEREGTTSILETTATAYGSYAHEFWKMAKRGENNYRALFFPWWECDPQTYRLDLLSPDELGTLSKEEQQLVDTHGLYLEEIKWRRHMIRELGGKALFLQQYPEDDESCWLAPGTTFYDGELLLELKQLAPRPSSVEDMNGLSLQLFDTRQLSNTDRAIIGADVGEGSDGDRSALTVRLMDDWRLAAKLADSSIEPNEFADILNTVGRRFTRNGMPALLVVEKNAHGITVLRRLRDELKYPVEFIYHREPLDSGVADPRQRVASDRIGWYTGAESQPLLLDAGRDLLNAAKDKLAQVPSDDAITDAFAVRRDKNGKVKLNGRDVLVSEMLAWIGRSYPIRHKRMTIRVI
jgi:hypothetical protein